MFAAWDVLCLKKSEVMKIAMRASSLFQEVWGGASVVYSTQKHVTEM